MQALRRFLTLALITIWAVTLPALAQLEETPKSFDFDAWEVTATRAEEIIQDAQASSPALETLRETLAGFRTGALSLQDANQARIETLTSQLAALGPAPEDGTVEAPEVASRRQELNEQLATARAPVLAAQEAYKRADGMIGEIDLIIRERLADQFFTLGISPLNPVYWPGAADALGGYLDDVREEILDALSSDAQMALATQNLPLILVLLVAGLLLLTDARKWLVAALGLLPQRSGAGSAETRNLLVATTRFIFPMAGVLALVEAVNISGLVGLRGALLLEAAPIMGFAIIGGYWLGQVLFSSTPGAPAFFPLDEKMLKAGRRLSGPMGLVLALDYLLKRIATQADFPAEAHVVLSFPIVLAAGLLLVRMGVLLDPRKSAMPTPAGENSLRLRVYGLVTRGAILLGGLGPLLAAIGYFTASTSFVFPALETLALFGGLLVAYVILANPAEQLFNPVGTPAQSDLDSKGSLLPVMLGLLLILASLPLFALIWGARVSDLQEIWTLVRDGFAIGERRVSALDFISFAAVFAAGYTLTKLLQSSLRTTVLPRTRLDSGGQNAILTGTGYVGVTLAALAAFTAAGLDLSSLAIVAGALSVGIGFGLQAIVSNFVSGVILLVERPIKAGDWVEVGAHSGYVRKISVRSTEIETFDRATVVVPNADFISGTVTNWTHINLNGRVKVPVGVSYDADPEKVRRILQEIAEAHPMVDHRFSVSVYFMGFGASSLDFELRAILKDVNWVLSVQSDLNFEIARRFREEEIEIPYPQRDLHVRDLDALGATIKTAMKDPT